MKETAKDRAAAQGGGFFENAAAQAAAPLPVDGFAPAQAAVETAPSGKRGVGCIRMKKGALLCVAIS